MRVHSTQIDSADGIYDSDSSDLSVINNGTITSTGNGIETTGNSANSRVANNGTITAGAYGIFLGASDGSTAERIFAVLKRTALATYGRDAVAPLTGPAWADFIAQTAGPRFEAGSFARLQAQAYGSGAAPEARDLEKLFAQARVWIRSHQAFVDAGSE